MACREICRHQSSSIWLSRSAQSHVLQQARSSLLLHRFFTRPVVCRSFLDITKAYDRVNTKKLVEKVGSFPSPQLYIDGSTRGSQQGPYQCNITDAPHPTKRFTEISLQVTVTIFFSLFTSTTLILIMPTSSSWMIVQSSLPPTPRRNYTPFYKLLWKPVRTRRVVLRS
jgi:hypothetical protein